MHHWYLADDRVDGLPGLGHLLLIHALEAVRILGVQIDGGGQGLGLAFVLLDLPGLQGAQALQAPVLIMQAGERLVIPLHAHLAGPGQVALLHQHLHKVQLYRLRADHHCLTGHQVHAAAGDESGVVAKGLRIHKAPPFVCF